LILSSFALVEWIWYCSALRRRAKWHLFANVKSSF
jgi:hypothetical protein